MLSSIRSYISNHRISFILWCIIAVGAALRFYSLSFGLPDLYQIDEEFFVDPALRIAQGHINPGWFGAPGQTVIYGVGIIFKLLHWIGRVIGGFHLSFLDDYHQHITLFQTLGRVLPALAGAAMIPLVYLIGQLWSKRIGLIAAGLTATSFYLVDHSHVIRPDIVQTLLILWVCYGLLQVLRQPNTTKWYIWIGVAFGLAVNTKYPSLFILPGVGVLLIILQIRHLFRWGRWLLAAVISLLTSFITGPFLYLDPVRVLHDVIIEGRDTHGGHDRLGFFGNLGWYFTHALDWEIGTLLFILTLIVVGLILVKIARRRINSEHDIYAAVVIAIMASYLGCLAVLNLHWERWVIPLIPLLFFFTAHAIDRIIHRLRHRPVLLVAILLILVIGPALRLIRTMSGYGHPYTVASAQGWAINNIPPDSTVAVEPYSPALPTNQYKIISLPNLSWHDLTWYRTQGIEYFIPNENVKGVMASEVDRLGSNTNFSNALKGYTELERNSALVYQIPTDIARTTKRLVESNDWVVLKTFRLDLVRGPYVQIFKLYQP
ncbi:MAG: glycosyltransferase family 39 protein [Patescibacteria group bacterium]